MRAHVCHHGAIAFGRKFSGSELVKLVLPALRVGIDPSVKREPSLKVDIHERTKSYIAHDLFLQNS
jgi:hypothetical protein